MKESALYKVDAIFDAKAQVFSLLVLIPRRKDLQLLPPILIKKHTFDKVIKCQIVSF